MKEVGQTISDKARTTIVIAVKLKPSYEGLSFLCAVILYVHNAAIAFRQMGGCLGFASIRFGAGD